MILPLFRTIDIYPHDIDIGHVFTTKNYCSMDRLSRTSVD